MGTLVKVALNYFGEIVYVRDENSAFSYGYIVGGNVGNILKTPSVKMFTQEESFAVYEFSSKVTINGKKMSGYSAYHDELMDSVTGKVDGMVSYKLNAENKIAVLNTGTMDKNDATPGQLILEKDGTYAYYKTPRSLSSNVRLDRDTKIFVIPYDLTAVERFDYNNFYEGLTNNTWYHAQIYNVDENRFAELVVVRAENEEHKTIDTINTPGYIVTESDITYINDAGDLAPAVKVKTLNGKTTEDAYIEVKFHTADMNSKGVMAKDLKPGDIFYATQNTRHREFLDISVKYVHGKTGAFDYTSRDQTGPTFNATLNGYIHAAGVVKKKIENGFTGCFDKDYIYKDDNTMDRVVTFASAVNVSIFDKSEQKLIPGYVGDITVGDWVYVVFSGYLAQEIIIYRP